MINSIGDNVWKADVYLRLSKNDCDERNSIQTQREIILDFVSRHPDIIIENYMVDDGYTGANYERNAFKNMICHIENGWIDCVIVRDLSRLGRDHIKTGMYIERYFTTKNVRFIAVSDNYDSIKDNILDFGNNLVVSLKNIFNEAFLEDISIKVKTQLEIKRIKGELVSNFTVYGYKKHDGELIVDEYAASVVRSIFNDKIDGYNEIQIASMLNEKEVLSPAEHKKSQGISYYTPFIKGEKATWSPRAVKRILSNRVYIGHLEQGKSTKTSYRIKHPYYKPRELWNIHENNHEPIINDFEFELVQELMAMDTRTSPGNKQLNLLSGFVICGLCKQPMYVRTTRKRNGKSYINYACSTHIKTGECRNNNVSGLVLNRIIMQSIRQRAARLLSQEEETDSSPHECKQTYIENMIERDLQVIRNNREFITQSYEHFANGTITETEYQMFKKNFNHRIKEAEKGITVLHNELNKLKNDTYDAKIKELILGFKDEAELNRRIVAVLIKSIVVHNCSEIDISFRYSKSFNFSTQRL